MVMLQICIVALLLFHHYFFYLGFTWTEQPLTGMKLRYKEEEKDEKDIARLLRKSPKKKGIYQRFT